MVQTRAASKRASQLEEDLRAEAAEREQSPLQEVEDKAADQTDMQEGSDADDSDDSDAPEEESLASTAIASKKREQEAQNQLLQERKEAKLKRREKDEFYSKQQQQSKKASNMLDLSLLEEAEYEQKQREKKQKQQAAVRPKNQKINLAQKEYEKGPITVKVMKGKVGKKSKAIPKSSLSDMKSQWFARASIERR